MTLYFKKHYPNAIIPKKAGINEVGYDLTLIKHVKIFGKNTIMYDTGISVEPPNGYYTEIVPRSSLVKTGYIMTNSIGIIDPTYRGTLKICVTRIDDTLPELILPCKKFQLIIRKMYNFSVKDIDKLTNTNRGVGGFGSTDLYWRPEARC